jgi:acyl-CoA reductase-like NAD-dependent aldehyde dehydrogenase
MEIDWRQRSRDLSLEVRNFVGGRWSEVGGAPLEKHSPRDGQILARFGSGTSSDVDDAVSEATRAFEDGRWSRLPMQRRKDVLNRLASLIDTHREELALLECLDVGKPIGDALKFDVPAAAATIRFNAEAADKFYGPVYAVDQVSLSYQLRQPLGVVAAIIGWNFPLVLAAAKIGPALVTGNSLVLKPSELTSFSASRVAELALEAGVPPGVFNVVHGGPDIGSALAHHCDVALVSFTGSTRTGKQLLIASGNSNMKRLILECGGKAPNIVFDDSPDLEAIADAVVNRAFWNQGQVCTASSRLLVHEGIKKALMPLIIERTAALLPRDPLDPTATYGALVSRKHCQRVWDFIDIGTQDGARVAYQNSVAAPHPEGFYISPVIFDEVRSDHRIAHEEIFGPVLSVISFRTEQEAIKVANDTIYGLSAMAWTKDLGRAHRLTYGLKVGWLVINSADKPTGGPDVGVVSVGGHKESGVGVEGGIEGLEAYVSKTAVQIFV